MPQAPVLHLLAKSYILLQFLVTADCYEEAVKHWYGASKMHLSLKSWILRAVRDKSLTEQCDD